MIAAGQFVEWSEVHGNLYGTPANAVDAARASGRDILLKIEVQGADAATGARWVMQIS